LAVGYLGRVRKENGKTKNGEFENFVKQLNNLDNESLNKLERLSDIVRRNSDVLPNFVNDLGALTSLLKTFDDSKHKSS
jgi:hypothetical protein